MKLNDILKEYHPNEFGPPDDYYDDGPDDPMIYKEELSCPENGHWFETLFYNNQSEWWFEGVIKNPLDGQNDAEFDKLFYGRIPPVGWMGDDWEDLYYEKDDRDKVIKGGPDPWKYGIDPDRNDNTNVSAWKKFRAAWLAWFKSLREDGTILSIEEIKDDVDDGRHGEPDERESTEADYSRASSDWQNSRGL